MPPCRQPRIPPGRHHPAGQRFSLSTSVLTFVSVAGTNHLLLDAVAGIESKNMIEEIEMQPRIHYAKVAPGAMTAMLGLETYVLTAGWSVR